MPSRSNETRERPCGGQFYYARQAAGTAHCVRRWRVAVGERWCEDRAPVPHVISKMAFLRAMREQFGVVACTNEASGLYNPPPSPADLLPTRCGGKATTAAGRLDSSRESSRFEGLMRFWQRPSAVTDEPEAPWRGVRVAEGAALEMLYAA